MPRFEMQLTYTELNDGVIETSEFEMICWVKNTKDLSEVQDTANSIIEERLEEAENFVLFGSAVIIVDGDPVMSIGFRNKNADPDEIDDAIDLMNTGEETIH